MTGINEIIAQRDQLQQLLIQRDMQIEFLLSKQNQSNKNSSETMSFSQKRFHEKTATLEYCLLKDLNKSLENENENLKTANKILQSNYNILYRRLERIQSDHQSTLLQLYDTNQLLKKSIDVDDTKMFPRVPTNRYSNFHNNSKVTSPELQNDVENVTKDAETEIEIEDDSNDSDHDIQEIDESDCDEDSDENTNDDDILFVPEQVSLIDLVDDSYTDDNLESDKVTRNIGSEKVNSNSSRSCSYDNSGNDQFVGMNDCHRMILSQNNHRFKKTRIVSYRIYLQMVNMSAIEETIEELRDRHSDERKHKNDLIAQNYELQKIMILKDSTIDRLLCNQTYIERQLKSAVLNQTNTQNRLDAMCIKEMSHQKKRMESQIEIDSLNREINHLTEDLNRSKAKITTFQDEQFVSSKQLYIDLQQKTTELRVAKSKICRLNKCNQSLKTQLEDREQYIREQIEASEKTTESYKKEVEAKIELVELHRKNSEDQLALINTLKADLECEKSTSEKFQIALRKKDIEIDCLKELVNLLTHNESSTATAYTELERKERDYNQLQEDANNMFEKIKVQAEELSALQCYCREIIASKEELTRKFSVYVAKNSCVQMELENYLLQMKTFETDCENVIRRLVELFWKLGENKEEYEKNICQKLLQDPNRIWNVQKEIINNNRNAHKRSVEDETRTLDVERKKSLFSESPSILDAAMIEVENQIQLGNN